MTPSRRGFLEGAGLLSGVLGLAAAVPSATRAAPQVSAGAAAPGASHTDEEAAALQAVLGRYAAFGDKASGGAGDTACGAWLEETLVGLGYRCRRQSFEVPFFEAREATLTCGPARATVLPQALVTATAAAGLTAPLRMHDGPEDLHGAIALVVLPAKRWARLADPLAAVPLAQALGRGAAAVVLITTGPSGEAIALNVSPRVSEPPGAGSGIARQVDRPVAVLAPKDAQPFLTAAAAGERGTLTMTGQGGGAARRPAFNLIARLERPGSHQTLVVSTPRSGWFGCCAERGSGLAVWLSLAAWLARTPLGVNVELLATSGHEYEYLGGERYLQDAAPPPADTRLWVHVGASAAARDWHELGPKLLPLPSADAQRVLTATADVLLQTRAAFQGISGLEATYLADAVMAGGELVNVLNAGYQRAIGLYGIHRFFHTRSDDLGCVSGALVQPVARAFRGAIRSAVNV